ncbi:MAG: tRNA-(ms[2]io[6]A)-hydroxylase [Pseudomonadota bacterium]
MPSATAIVAGASFADDVPDPIRGFLQVPSSDDWARAAAADLPTLLVDHANCELKAASTALSLMHRYPGNAALTYRMSRLAREELRHFEQVQKIMLQREWRMRPLSASGYAAGLRSEVARQEPDRLVDTLIVGALIEARSCERFALVAPYLPDDLAIFYRGLLASEARHFEQYLQLAEQAARAVIRPRVDALREVEQHLINVPVTAAELRFHSGPPKDA